MGSSTQIHSLGYFFSLRVKIIACPEYKKYPELKEWDLRRLVYDKLICSIDAIALLAVS